MKVVSKVVHLMEVVRKVVHLMKVVSKVMHLTKVFWLAKKCPPSENGQRWPASSFRYLFHVLSLSITEGMLDRS
jgi:hypothetical protein